MQWLRNMKIRSKMLLAFFVVVILGAMTGVIGIISTQILTNSAKELETFQNESSTLTNILNAHYTWRNGLTETVMTGTEFTGSLDSATCTLGSWLSSEDAAKITDKEILSLINQIKAPHNSLHQDAVHVLAKVKDGDLIGAQAYLTTNISPQLKIVIDGLCAIEARYDVLVGEKVLEMENLGAFITIIIVATIVFAVVIAFIVAMIISNSFSEALAPMSVFMNRAGSTGDIEISPSDAEVIGKFAKKKDELGITVSGAASFVMYVTQIAEQLESIAGGDLTAKPEVLSEKDLMGQALVHTVNNFNKLFAEINISTTHVSSGARQIADASQTLAQGSTEQAATIQQLAASTGEIAEKTRANSEMAGSAAQMAGTIRQNAEKGARQMSEMMSAVSEINNASQSIGKVIKVIDDIAFQTNILALNAAVEAARAGQHGKGFAVVADEVRNLAAKSAAAAKDTSDLIQNSIEKSELGSRIANETSASLEEIVAGINESAKLISKIAELSEGQTSAIMQINTEIDQVATVVQQNSATAEECAAASEEMSGQSELLEQLVAQFKLRDNPANKGSAIIPAAAAVYTDSIGIAPLLEDTKY